PRIALGGAVSGLDGAPQGDITDNVDGSGDAVDGSIDDVEGNVSIDDVAAAAAPLSPDDRVDVNGPFTADGTLVKPAAVDMTVADGKELMRTYRVRSGDTL